MPNRSRELNTRGIVLRKIPFKETSYIVDVLSRDLGHISLMAKGARSAKSKYVGHLELLNELDLTLYHNPNSEWHIYKSSALLKTHLFETTFRAGIVMQAAVEILRQILVTTDDAPEMFDLLKKYVEYIRTINKNEIVIFWRYLLSLFKNIGIEFNLTNCAICSREDNFAGYYPQKHGLICRQCYRPVHESYILSLNTEIQDLIQKLPHIGNYLDDLNLANHNIQKINQILLIHLSEHLHKKFYLNSIELY